MENLKWDIFQHSDVCFSFLTWQYVKVCRELIDLNAREWRHHTSGRSYVEISGVGVNKNDMINNLRSILQAELFAIPVHRSHGYRSYSTTIDAFIIVDTLSPLLVLNILTPKCNRLVSEARSRYASNTGKRTQTKLSHSSPRARQSWSLRQLWIRWKKLKQNIRLLQL